MWAGNKFRSLLVVIGGLCLWKGKTRNLPKNVICHGEVSPDQKDSARVNESVSMIPWDKLHGGITHFPIALVLFSTVCDFVSVTFKKLPFAQELRSVSRYGLAVAALASFGAVVSGIAITKGDLWGRGDFLWHHRFIWPAFGLLVGLAVWRLVVKDAMAGAALYIYLILMTLASGFIAAAGYFGGELLLSGGVQP